MPRLLSHWLSASKGLLCVVVVGSVVVAIDVTVLWETELPALVVEVWVVVVRPGVVVVVRPGVIVVDVVVVIYAAHDTQHACPTYWQ